MARKGEVNTSPDTSAQMMDSAQMVKQGKMSSQTFDKTASKSPKGLKKSSKTMNQQDRGL